MLEAVFYQGPKKFHDYDNPPHSPWLLSRLALKGPSGKIKPPHLEQLNAQGLVVSIQIQPKLSLLSVVLARNSFSNFILDVSGILTSWVRAHTVRTAPAR